jgi:hypothetical protein
VTGPDPPVGVLFGVPHDRSAGDEQDGSGAAAATASRRPIGGDASVSGSVVP